MAQSAQQKEKRNLAVAAIAMAWDAGEWVVTQAVMPALEKLIPQGASELANALFRQSSAYVPYGPTQKPVPKPKAPGHGVHGPEKTLEEKAAELVALDEAKAAERVARRIDREVSDMTPEEQAISEKFRSKPTDMNPPEI
ncbi:MAG: hypothetical protein P4L85_14075 [Paludisphaera borealis]|uniref:hypothetical protein n=1 Tax=Paludisphaera borealis TaxID=1387353 RepID=UPI002850AEA4|nr:hypothetical protein [Paludisphaera borealis]MDR3620474.1 hypothetical protein [Paludisphaera borealis]